MPKKDDKFNRVYDLVNNALYDDSLKILLSGASQHLNGDFKFDENHAWYLIGDIYCKKLEYEKAINAFKKSLLARNDDIEAMWALGNCYMELKLPKKAEKILECSLQISKKQEIIYNYANSLFDQQKYNRALKYYKKLLKIKVIYMH